MAPSTRFIGILISLALSAVLVIGAFVLTSAPGPSIAGAESTEALLRAYAEQDTDGDELMDWQESLYGSDPNDPYSLDLVMTDREAVDSGKFKPRFESDHAALDALSIDASEIPGIEAGPSTLTDRFARKMFEKYLSTGVSSGVPTGDDLILFVNEELESMSAGQGAEPVYFASSITKAESGADALRAYAIAAERIGQTHLDIGEKSELFYFEDVVRANNAKALEMVRAIGEGYRKAGEEYARLPVPPEAAAAHLRTANALDRLGKVVTNMATLHNDPLLALVALGSYEAAMYEFAYALEDLHEVFSGAAVVITPNEPGYSFYRTIEYAAAKAPNSR